METAIIIAAIILSITALAALKQYLGAKERRAMIEKGLDPSLAGLDQAKHAGLVFLYAGVLLLGLALGILTGILLASLFRMPGETKEFIYLSVLIFSGLSAFVCYYLARRYRA